MIHSVPGRQALLLVLAAVSALAFDFGALKPQGYVSDFAGVIDAAGRAELNRYLGEIEKSAGVQIAFVTLDTLGGEPVEDVANVLFRKWGIGQKQTNEGLLLLLVVRDRRSRVEVGYGLEPIIPDGFAGGLLREMRPALRENHFTDAFRIAAQIIGGRISTAKGVKLDPGAVQVSAPRPRGTEIPWPVILGGIGALALFGLSSRRRRGGFFPVFLPGSFGSSSSWSSSHSSGGFGGYDSSDSFGGFGGGDSGGGGASSDW